MIRRPPRSTRSYTPLPVTTLFRFGHAVAEIIIDRPERAAGGAIHGALATLIAKDRREGDIIRKRLLVIERPAGHPDVARGIEGRIEGVGIIIGLEEAVVRDTLNAVRNLILALIAAREQDRKSTRLTPVTNAHLVCSL